MYSVKCHNHIGDCDVLDQNHGHSINLDGVVLDTRDEDEDVACQVDGQSQDTVHDHGVPFPLGLGTEQAPVREGYVGDHVVLWRGMRVLL